MRIVLVSLLLLLSTGISAAVQKHSLQAALRAGLVEMRAASNGNLYYRNALQLELRNTTQDLLQLRVDPALVFRPADTSFQDLILPGGELLVLSAGGSRSIPLQSFCGTLHARAPGDSIRYELSHQGDSLMIRVAQYIGRYRLYDALGQAAIWALTDHRNLSGILDPERPQESAALLAFLETETDWKRPDYFRLFSPGTAAGEPVFQKRRLEIVSQFELRLEAPKVLSMGVYNAAGKEVQAAFKAQQMKVGTYRLMVRFEAEGAAPGAYFLRVTEGAAVLREQRVVVE